MTSLPGPGRRDNGLPGHDWGALVDLDPRLSEALLMSLSAAGVAAYVEPASGSEPLTRAAQLPARPMHRLWVDPARADDARRIVTAEVADLTELLAELEPGATAHGLVQAVPRTADRRVLSPPLLPGPPRPAEQSPTGPAEQRAESGPTPPGGAGTTPGQDDPEAIWAALVAGFALEHQGKVAPWPVSEDLDPPPARPAGRPSDPAQRRRFTDRSPEQSPWSLRRRPERTGGGDTGQVPDAGVHSPGARARRDDDPSEQALPGWVEPEALEDDGHYEPPPPPPVPRPAPPRIAAALGLLAGVLLMLAPQVLGQTRSAGLTMFGVLVTVCGTGAFVYLMRDDDSGPPDDGAVV